MEKTESKEVLKSNGETIEKPKNCESKSKLAVKEEKQKPLRDFNTPAKTGKTNPKLIVSSIKGQRKRASTSGSPKPKSISKNLTSSARKPIWRRRPLPAHSGVPVPEKMKKLSLKLLNMDFYKNEQI